MIKLTATQEKTIIQMLREKLNKDDLTFIGNGAARFVYSCPADVSEYLGIDKYIDLVIKIGLGYGGYNQVQNEILAYEEYHQDYNLGKIYAAGSMLEIMEYVDALSDGFRDYTSYNNDVDDAEIFIQDYELYDCYTPEEVIEIFEVATSLEDIFGITNDNGQLGRTQGGDIVAYDYGYYAHYNEDQTSALTDYVNPIGKTMKEYLEELEKIFEQEHCVEKMSDFICTLESQMDDYFNSVEWSW